MHEGVVSIGQVGLPPRQITPEDELLELEEEELDDEDSPLELEDELEGQCKFVQSMQHIVSKFPSVSHRLSDVPLFVQQLKLQSIKLI